MEELEPTQKSEEEQNRVEVVVVEEPHIRIGMQQIYDMILRVAEGNQRLEAKVDAVSSNQTIQMGNLASHIVRVEAEHARDGAELRQELDKLSDRLRTVELAPKVTPRALQAGIGIVLAVLSVGVAIIAIIAAK